MEFYVEIWTWINSKTCQDGLFLLCKMMGAGFSATETMKKRIRCSEFWIHIRTTTLYLQSAAGSVISQERFSILSFYTYIPFKSCHTQTKNWLPVMFQCGVARIFHIFPILLLLYNFQIDIKDIVTVCVSVFFLNSVNTCVTFCWKGRSNIYFFSRFYKNGLHINITL